ncbi:MAG: MmgE/PrpD family protein [Chloroflexota bacterium]
MSETVSTKWARFITGIKYEDLPEAVVSRAKDLFLDHLGIQIGISVMPWCKAVFQYVKDMNVPGKVPVMNYGFRTHPEFASLANGTFAHGFEMDDWYPQGAGHPGCVAVPSAMAYAEEIGGGGKDAIVGTVIGYEIISRLARGMGQSLIHDRGVHATSAEGVFGATGVAARMLGLTEAEAVHAFGLAASHAGGVMEFARTGGEVKRYHAGLACSSGGRCAQLAKCGLTAPPTAIEGKRGVLQALTNKYDVEVLTSGLGQEYRIFEVGIKAHAAPADMHPMLEGARAVMDKNRLKAEDVKEVELGVHNGAMWHLGSVGPRPKDVTEAQFSVHFGIAMNLVKGENTFAVIMDQKEKGFRDPEVLAMADKVKMVVDEETERLYPKVRQARVTIRTNDGREFSELAVSCKGMPDKPMTKKELEAKFRGLATLVLPASRVEQIVQMAGELEKLDKLSRLTSLCVA